MMQLNSKAAKIEFLKGLQAKVYSIEDISKDNYNIFLESEREILVRNCRTQKTEIMNSDSLREWEKINNGKHQIILYVI